MDQLIFTLSAEEENLLKSFDAHADARVQGYADGMQAAKRMFIEFFIIKRKAANDTSQPSAESGTERPATPQPDPDAASGRADGSRNDASPNADVWQPSGPIPTNGHS